MNSNQISCFRQSAQCLNFTTAAERLYISQPALSRNISALEDELELMLFERRNNVLSLTAGGEILFHWLEDSSVSFAAVLDKARAANSGQRNSLRLGFVKTELPSRNNAEAIARFEALHPEVEISITHYISREIVQHLMEHSMDVALMIGSAVYGNSRLQYLEVGGYRRCMAVSLAHPMAERFSASLRDFSTDTFISVRPSTSPTMTAMIQRVCGGAGFSPKILEAVDVEQQISWVESGKGVALLVSNNIERFNTLLRFVEIDENLPVSLICAWDRLNGNPNIKEFISILDSIEKTG